MYSMEACVSVMASLLEPQDGFCNPFDGFDGTMGAAMARAFADGAPLAAIFGVVAGLCSTLNRSN